MSWQEIRDPATGHLLARIDPERKLLELHRKRSSLLVDLDPYWPQNELQNVLEDFPTSPLGGSSTSTA